jgi:hypothetical protein
MFLLKYLRYFIARIKGYGVWLFVRLWHLWIPIVIFITVIIVGKLCPNQASTIFKISSMFMQAFGVALLVYVLNLNMITIRDASILVDAKKWMMECPHNKKTGVVSFPSITVTATVSAPKIRGKVVGNTLEERIKVLEGEIEDVRKENGDNRKFLTNKIEKYKDDSNNNVAAVNAEIRKIEAKLEGAVIGDYRLQLFSTIIIMLGLIISILPVRPRSESLSWPFL